MRRFILTVVWFWALAIFVACSEPEPETPPPQPVALEPDLAWNLLAMTNVLDGNAELRKLAFANLQGDPLAYFFEGAQVWRPLGFGAYVPGMTSADLLGEDYVGFANPALLETAPGEEPAFAPTVSHYSARTDAPMLQVSLRAYNDLGGKVELLARPRRVKWQAGATVRQPPVTLEVPDLRNSAGAITLELITADGERLAANLLPVLIWRDLQPTPRVEALHSRRIAVRAPANPLPAGSTAIRFDIPPRAFEAGLAKLQLLAEIAVLEGKAPVRVELAGRELGAVRVPPVAADARSVLSLWSGYTELGHGALLDLEPQLDAGLVAALRQNPVLRLSVERGYSLRVFGEGTGRYPLDPTLVLVTEEPCGPTPARPSR